MTSTTQGPPHENALSSALDSSLGYGWVEEIFDLDSETNLGEGAARFPVHGHDEIYELATCAKITRIDMVYCGRGLLPRVALIDFP